MQKKYIFGQESCYIIHESTIEHVSTSRILASTTFDHMIVFWKTLHYFSQNSYRLVSQIVNETMEKGMATFLNYYISGRLAVERFAIEIIRRRSGGYVHGGFTFFSIHLSIWKNTVHPISDRAYNQICILWFSWDNLEIELKNKTEYFQYKSAWT